MECLIYMKQLACARQYDVNLQSGECNVFASFLSTTTSPRHRLTDSLY